MSESPVAIVTGGAQGLGAAMSKTLLKNGYKVCVSDIQEEKGKQFVKEQQDKFGTENVIFIAGDVTKEKDYKDIFDFTMKEFKRMDVVLNNAGIMFEENPRKTLEVNLMGPIIGCQLAFQYMGKSNGGKGGMVINTSSLAGFLPGYVHPAYTASKHGLIGLTRSYGLPYHFKRDGILFTAICPSFIDTAMLNDRRTKTLVAGFDTHQENEVMSPDYVAEGILKLLEDRINGSTLVVSKFGYKYVSLQEELKSFRHEVILEAA